MLQPPRKNVPMSQYYHCRYIYLSFSRITKDKLFGNSAIVFHLHVLIAVHIPYLTIQNENEGSSQHSSSVPKLSSSYIYQLINIFTIVMLYTGHYEISSTNIDIKLLPTISFKKLNIISFNHKKNTISSSFRGSMWHMLPWIK